MIQELIKGVQKMLGSIAGDIIGSVYEHHNIKTAEFELFGRECKFTDDSVLTAATADAIMSGSDYTSKYKEYYNYYPEAGYGKKFIKWANSDSMEPYGSFGNGSAMRVSPVAYAFDTLEKVLAEAEKTAAATHNHPEGIKGAQAVAAAIFMSRSGIEKNEIKTYIETNFKYDLDRSISSIRKNYRFDVSCQGSVPQSIRAFIESTDFESAVRLAVSIGGDSDTIACIAGGIAEAYYKEIPEGVKTKALEKLDDRLKLVVTRFYEKYIQNI